MPLTEATKRMFNRPPLKPRIIGNGVGKGFSVTVMGYAGDENDVAVVNMIGKRGDVEAAYRQFTSGRITIGMKVVPRSYGNNFSIRCTKDGTYRLITHPLESYGLVNGLIMNELAVNPPPGSPYAYAAGNTIEELVKAVGSRIHRSSKIAILPEWYEELFEEGVRKNMIYYPDTEGANYVYIDLEQSAWQDIVSRKIASGVIGF